MSKYEVRRVIYGNKDSESMVLIGTHEADYYSIDGDGRLSFIKKETDQSTGAYTISATRAVYIATYNANDWTSVTMVDEIKSWHERQQFYGRIQATGSATTINTNSQPVEPPDVQQRINDEAPHDDEGLW